MLTQAPEKRVGGEFRTLSDSEGAPRHMVHALQIRLAYTHTQTRTDTHTVTQYKTHLLYSDLTLICGDYLIEAQPGSTLFCSVLTHDQLIL